MPCSDFIIEGARKAAACLDDSKIGRMVEPLMVTENAELYQINYENVCAARYRNNYYGRLLKAKYGTYLLENQNGNAATLLQPLGTQASTYT